MLKIFLKNRRMLTNVIRRQDFSTENVAFAHRGTKPKKKVPQVEMSKNDMNLVNLGDFRLIKPSTALKEKDQIWNVGNEYLNFLVQFKKTFKIKSSDFMNYILLPLERGETNLLKIIQNDPKSVVNLTLFCGKSMCDTSASTRNIILDRLWNAFEKNNLKITLNGINARLKVWIENNKYFNVDDQLRDLEITRKLTPDVKFLNHMMIQLANSGMKSNLLNFKNEMLKKGFNCQKEFDLALIRCLSVRKMHMECDKAIKIFIGKYGYDSKSAAFTEAMLGSSQQYDLKRLKILLESVVDKTNEQKLNLMLDNEVIMDIIWNLGTMSSSNNESEIANLVEKILLHSNRAKGFFKLLNRDINRHIHEKNYNIAASMFNSLFLIGERLKEKGVTTLNVDLSNVICKSMVKNRVDKTKIRSIVNRLLAAFKNNHRVFDDLAYAILTFNGYKNHERLDMLLSYIDDIDPTRERFHLIYPVFAGNGKLGDNLTFLYRWMEAGYYDINMINTFSLSYYIFNPLLNSLKFQYKSLSDYDRLEKLAKILKTYLFEDVVIWNMISKYKNMLENRSTKNQEIYLSNINLWLQENYESMVNKKINSEVYKTEDELITQLLMYIDSKKFDDIHNLMDNSNTFRMIDVSPFVDKILELYLSYGNLEQLMTFLTNISNFCKPVDGREEVLTLKQIYFILQKFLSVSNDINKMIELLYNIKTKFPNPDLGKETYASTVKEIINLINKFFCSPSGGKLKKEDLNSIQVFLTTLYKLDFINFPTNDVITSTFITLVLNHCCWNDAVKVWLKFQSQHLCSNGLIFLLNYALVNLNDLYKLNYVMHKAQVFMTQSRVNAFYIGSLIYCGCLDKAYNEITKFKEPIKPTDVLHVYKLLNNFIQSDKKIQINLSFLKICLEHTNLKKNENIMNELVNHWLSLCEQKNLRSAAFNYYKLFKDYRHPFTSEQNEKITEYIKSSNYLVGKWINDKNSRVLNLIKTPKTSKK